MAVPKKTVLRYENQATIYITPNNEKRPEVITSSSVRPLSPAAPFATTVTRTVTKESVVKTNDNPGSNIYIDISVGDQHKDKEEETTENKADPKKEEPPSPEPSTSSAPSGIRSFIAALLGIRAPPPPPPPPQQYIIVPSPPPPPPSPPESSSSSAEEEDDEMMNQYEVIPLDRSQINKLSRMMNVQALVREEAEEFDGEVARRDKSLEAKLSRKIRSRIMKKKKRDREAEREAEEKDRDRRRESGGRYR